MKLHSLAFAALLAGVALAATRDGLAQDARPETEEVVCVTATFVFPPAEDRYRVVPSVRFGDRPVSFGTFGKMARCRGWKFVANNKVVKVLPYLPRFGPVLTVEVGFQGCSPTGHRIYTTMEVELTRSGGGTIEVPASAILDVRCDS